MCGGRAKDFQRFFPLSASAVTREIRLKNERRKAQEQKIDNNAKRKKKRLETFSTSFITPHKSIFASTREEPSFDTGNSCIFRFLSVPFLNDSLHTARAVGASVCAPARVPCAQRSGFNERIRTAVREELIYNFALHNGPKSFICNVIMIAERDT